MFYRCFTSDADLPHSIFKSTFNISGGIINSIAAIPTLVMPILFCNILMLLVTFKIALNIFSTMEKHKNTILLNYVKYYPKSVLFILDSYPIFKFFVLQHLKLQHLIEFIITWVSVSRYICNRNLSELQTVTLFLPIRFLLNS